MRLGLLNGLALAALTSLWCSAAIAQDATTREREALSSRAANRIVQQDLLSVFEPVKQIDSGMFRQLRGVGLTTRAFGTEFDGLCRRDAVTLWYAATVEGTKPEDTPVRPYSVEAQALFHIAHLPRRQQSERRGGADIWQSGCASSGRDENTNWFAAKDARTAFQGALVLIAAVDAIRSGALKSDPCPSILDTKKLTCEAAILADGGIAKIDSVEACAATAGTLCYIVDLASSTKLTIKGRAPDDALVPTAITSIAIEQYIIVT